MSINLVIVESAAKCKTISKYLNSSPSLKKYGKFIVVASLGHIRDLPKKELGIDIDNGFKATYVVSDDKKKVVTDLIKKKKEANFVWLATDADLEGAAISQAIKDELKLKQGSYKRIVFTEITQKALENAIENAGDIDTQKVEAQETRRVLDRLVGFKLSPLLWKRYTGVIGLSAGRVQSAALNIIIDKENEISNFVSSPYWYIQGKFKDIDNELKLYGSDNKVYKTNDATAVKSLLTKVSKEFYVKDAKSRKVTQKPDLPFITSTLQQEAYSKHGFAIKHTMQLAQNLYEAGHITYMRTDSYVLSDDFVATTKTYIDNQFGAAYVAPDNERKKSKKSKGAQEAHEAIRPTNPSLEALPISNEFGNDHRKLYDLIRKRAVASLMKAAVFDEIDMKIGEKTLDKQDMYFVATDRKCQFNGYLAIYGVKNDNYDLNALIENAANFKIKCKLLTAKNTWTSPPARYNDSSIIKVLEQEGIGRPSTYASILAKIFEKRYVIKTDVSGTEKEVIHYTIVPTKELKEITETMQVGAEKTRIVPTDIGLKIHDFLKDKFDYIIDKSFTSHMEADLDKIAEGDKTKNVVLSTFWKKFGTDLSVLEGMKVSREKVVTQSKVVKVDGTDYTIRLAKFGPVIQNGDKYIGLKPYLFTCRKEYMEIGEDDIRLLISLPKKIGKYEGKDVTVNYGAYGFYAKYGTFNIKIYPKTITTFIKEGNISVNDIKGNIEYALKSKTTKDNQGGSSALTLM